MIPTQFTKLIADLENLTDSQVRYVEKLLKGADSASQLISELEERMVEKPECPHCHSSLKATKLEGIIEADETLFAYSEKGSKKLTRQPRKRGKKAGAL